MTAKSNEHKPIQPQNDDLDDEKASMEKSPNNGDPFTFTFDALNPSYLDETRQIYTKECPSLQTDQAKQDDLLKLLSWQRHSDYPLMLHIIDSYHRDNLQYFQNDHKNMTFKEWTRQYKTVVHLLQHVHIQSTEERGKIFDIIQSAITTYTHRSCSALDMNSITYLISDSIQGFALCIQETLALIHTWTNDPTVVPPFQVDLLIIPHNIVDLDQKDTDEPVDETEFDDDSEDDSDDDYEPNTAPNTTAPTPCEANETIGSDIGDNLKGIQVIYAKDEMEIRVQRTLRDLWTKYNAALHENGGQVSSAPVDSVHYDLQATPHGKRVCIVIDRRLKEKPVYMFVPPKFGTIGKTHEWYIESSSQYIMPDHHKKAIKAITALNGWINVFSFHVEQKKEIRCYLYRTNAIFRFMPSDVIDLFPLLFDMGNDENEEYVKLIKDDPDILSRLHWKDCKFEKFRKQFK
eukprot:909621_1